MKKAIIALFILSTSLAHAEHEATYCGKVSTDQSARVSGESEAPEGVLIVKYERLSGDAWEDIYETVNGFAAFYVDGLPQTQQALLQNQKLLSPKHRSDICVRGSWGGSLYHSTNIRNMSLHAADVYQIFVKR